jgi:hypothetical protein
MIEAGTPSGRASEFRTAISYLIFARTGTAGPQSRNGKEVLVLNAVRLGRVLVFFRPSFNLRRLAFRRLICAGRLRHIGVHRRRRFLFGFELILLIFSALILPACAARLLFTLRRCSARAFTVLLLHAFCSL